MKLTTPLMTSGMPPANAFRDQVNVVTGWFSTWSECEQTIAIYTLLRRASPPQTRFLQQVLDQLLADCADRLQPLEAQANDPAYIGSLAMENDKCVVSKLINGLLLLRSGNEEAKNQYMKAIPNILGKTSESSIQVEETSPLLSYSLIHPALSANDKAQVKSWLWQLEERYAHDATNAMPLCNEISAPFSLNGNPMPGSLPPQSLFCGHQNLFSVPPPPPPSMVNASFARSFSCDSSSSNNSNSDFDATRLNNLSQFPYRPPLKVAVNGNQSEESSYNGSLSSKSTGYNVFPQSAHPSLGLTLQTCPSPAGFSPSGSLTPGHRKLVRSASDAQSSPSSISRAGRGLYDWYQKGNTLAINTKSGTSTPDTGHQSLSPENSTGSSSGETCPDDYSPRNVFVDEASGMREVPIWLKGLRLHKYAHLFQTMTYEQMLDVDDVWLESQNVTKGARNKILLSLKKLKERQSILRGIEKEIAEGGNIRQALSDIRNILGTPLKAYQGISKVIVPPSSDLDAVPEGDLPGQITRTLGKVCTQLLVSPDSDDECHHCYVQLLDKCIQHISAFTQEQKRKMASWRLQVTQMIPNNKYNNGLLRRGSYTTQVPNSNSRPLRGQVLPSGQPRWSFTGPPPANTAIPPPSVLSPSLPQSGSYPIPSVIPPTSSLNYPVLEAKKPLCHTRSAPISSDCYRMSYATEMSLADHELTARLDDLCLSMTNHALEGSFDVLSDRCSTF